MKVHELCHISLFVKAFGPPMGNSCFPYGNANDLMKVGSLFVKAFGPPMGNSCFPYGNANDLMKVGAWYKIHCLTGL